MEIAPNKPSRSLIEIVDAWGVDRPNAMAVESGAGQYTYAELKALSDVVAVNLIAAGVLPGDVVAMCLPRVKEVWPVILGIFKAGAIYLPLETDWPKERVSFILAQADCHKIIGTSVASDHSNITCFFFKDLFVGSAESAPASLVKNQSAYIIFTSGSTGAPKGVEITHCSLIHLLTEMGELLGVDSTLRQLCITAFSFDLVIPDLFLPLVFGGCCVLADNKDVSLLPALLNDKNINLLQATPSTYRRLIDSHWPGREGLAAVIGGDKVEPALADALVAKVARLWHCYGPTETTVWAAINRHFQGGSLGFSNALPGYQFYLVDSEGELLTKAGDKGELLIGGPGVALGYVGDLEQTAKSFVDADFAAAGKIYKTGDIFQLGENGSEWLYRGRNDSQVKVNGYRVELGEIERAVQRVKGVEQSVALLSEGQIQVYYIAFKGAGFIESSIRRNLAEFLPWYMLPKQYFMVDSFPLTANQKVDRKLLALQAAATQIETPHEEGIWLDQLRSCWLSVFGTHIAVDDNVFDQGLDSLAAVNFLVAIEEHLNLNLPLSFVYTYPSLSQMSAALAFDDEYCDDAKMLCFQAGSGTPLICFHPVGGGVQHYRLLASSIDGAPPIYGIQAQGYDGGPPLDNIHSMANRYAELIIERFGSQPVNLLGGSMGGVLALETAKQLAVDNGVVEKVYLIDSVGAGTSQSAAVKQLSLKKLFRGVKLRLADRVLSIRAWWALYQGRRLANKIRYDYITMVNQQALSNYFSCDSCRKKYNGQVVLIRQPLAESGVYSDQYLGWRGVIPSDSSIYYVAANHEKFIESEGFQKLFRAIYGLPKSH